MTGLDAVPGQTRRCPRDRQVGRRVAAIGVGGEQAELHAVGQLLGLEAGGAGGLLRRPRRGPPPRRAPRRRRAGGPARGPRGPPSASPSTAGGGGTEPGPPATVGRGSPRSRASRCSLMTRSGRYWSRWAARTYRSRLTSARENFRYPEGVRCGWTRSSDSRYRILLIVTSGKSSRRTASTSPMVSRGVCRSAASPSARSRSGTAVTSLSRRRPCGARGAGSLASGRLAGARAGEVHETELADLHLVTAGEGRHVHRLAVDVGAVEAADVVDGEPTALAVELHVPAADGHVVEEDVAVGVAARRRHVLVQQEPAARVGAALDHQQRRPGREGLHGAGVRVGRRLGDLGLLGGVLAADLGDHTRRLTDALLGERRAALGAEATALGVLMSTSSAVHVAS